MKQTAPSWSIRGRSAYSRTERIPGPGSYSPNNSVLQSSPNYRVGTAKRKPLADFSFTPGPGAYSPFKTVDTPSWSL